MSGQIETGLPVKEECTICAGIDEIGRATKLMTRTSPKNIFQTMTKGSLLVTDNTDCDDIDDDDDLAVDWEVESYAAAAANSTSQPHETIVQNPSAESQLS